MVTYRFKPTAFAVNPAADSGTSVTGSGAGFSDVTKLAAFAGQCDNVPSSFPGGFPSTNDIVAYQNAIAYFDASVAGSRSDLIRPTNYVEIGTDIPIATKLIGHTNIQITRRFGLMDGDVYSGFPGNGGGLFRLYGVRVEARNGSGAIAGTYQQFANIFEDGSNPAMLHLTSNPWSVSLAQLSTAFGINFYVYNSDNADSSECTANFGVYAIELTVTADPPAGVGAKLATHPVALRLGLSL